MGRTESTLIANKFDRQAVKREIEPVSPLSVLAR